MQTLRLHERNYVVLEREEYDRLATRAKACDLPPLPKPDKDGNVPAVEFCRATIARDIIRERAEAGLTKSPQRPNGSKEKTR